MDKQTYHIQLATEQVRGLKIVAAKRAAEGREENWRQVLRTAIDEVIKREAKLERQPA